MKGFVVKRKPTLVADHPELSYSVVWLLSSMALREVAVWPFSSHYPGHGGTYCSFSRMPLHLLRKRRPIITNLTRSSVPQPYLSHEEKWGLRPLSSFRPFCILVIHRSHQHLYGGEMIKKIPLIHMISIQGKKGEGFGANQSEIWWICLNII